MKALLSTVAGGPETLTLDDVPDPPLTPGNVIVDVRAVGVNYPDVLIIQDRYQFKPERPFSPGGELAGVVSEVGEGVSNLRIGDRVLGVTSGGWGGMCERVAFDANRLIRIPDKMPFDEAAAFLLTYGTSWHALNDRAGLRAGQTVLVLGAAGGVGLAAVELANAVGAHVVAAVSSEEKLKVCLERGAKAGIIYPRGPLSRDDQKALGSMIKDAVGNDGADVIYDPIGDAYAEPALRAIAWEGKYLVVGFAAGEIPRIPLNLPLLKGCSILGVFWGAWVERNPQAYRESVSSLMALYLDGKVKPLISKTFPFEQAAEAIDHLASRRAVGKVVVTG